MIQPIQFLRDIAARNPNARGSTLMWGIIITVSLSVGAGRWLLGTVSLEKAQEGAISAFSSEVANAAPEESKNWQRQYEAALELARTAQSYSQIALSEEDWGLVVSKLERSVQMLQSIPQTDLNYADAQAMRQELTLVLTFAYQQKTLPRNPFPRALQTAIIATELTQTATSASDWWAVSEQWQSAIALMDAVPTFSTDYAQAQQKVGEYQGYLDTAQRNAAIAEVGIAAPGEE